MTPRLKAFAGVLSVALGLWAATNPIARASPPSETVDKELAKRAVRKANAAFAEGRYQDAIGLYERAMDLRTSPKLHYNIGVCHHQLATLAEESANRDLHRQAAVEHYNRYLAENPDPDDAAEVAAFVRDLGGEPAEPGSAISAGDTEDPGADTDGEDTDGEDADGEDTDGEDTDGEDDSGPGDQGPQGPDSHANEEGASVAGEGDNRRPIPPDRAKVGIHLNLGFNPLMFNLDNPINGASVAAVELHGGGLVGSRKRLLLGAQLSFWAGGGAGRDALGFIGTYLGFILDYSWVLGDSKRWEIGLGTVISYSRQSVRSGQDNLPLCRATGNDRTLVGARNGGMVQGRFAFGLLFGQRRMNQVSLHLQPGVGFYGRGSSGTADCEDGARPLPVLGLPRVQAPVHIGLGYTLRI